MKVRKSTTHSSFLFGDFDKDGVKNVDDFKPFDRMKSKWPKKLSYYNKSRFGGFETKLSEVLRDVEAHANKHSSSMKDLVKDYKPGTKGRIKTVPSILNKLFKKNILDVHDIAGVTLVVDKKTDVMAKVAEVKKREKINKDRTKNFYEDPKDDVYYAYHMEVLNPLPVELQIKTKKMEELHVKQHKDYKKGKSMKKYIKQSRALLNKGY